MQHDAANAGTTACRVGEKIPGPPAGLTHDSPRPRRALSSALALLQKKQAPCCYYKRPRLIAYFPFQTPREHLITLFFFFFKHQFIKMHSSSSTGWEKVKHRCCQEGNGGRQPFCSQTARGSQIHLL